MKGHNFGECKKCGKLHKHPKGMLNKKHSEKTKKVISKCSINLHKIKSFGLKKGHTKSVGEKNGMFGVRRFGKDSPAYGYRHLETNIEKIRSASIKVWENLTLEEYETKCKNIGLGNKGKVRTKEARKLMSESAIKRVLRNGMCISLGINEKQILDGLENEYVYKILRQYQVGLYFLDGYIPELNLAIEVDEVYININGKGNLYPRDIKRQQEIEDKLGCQFRRIKA